MIFEKGQTWAQLFAKLLNSEVPAGAEGAPGEAAGLGAGLLAAVPSAAPAGVGERENVCAGSEFGCFGVMTWSLKIGLEPMKDRRGVPRRRVARAGGGHGVGLCPRRRRGGEWAPPGPRRDRPLGVSGWGTCAARAEAPQEPIPRRE